MSNKSTDIFARVTSILALFFALLAVIVPYIQQSKQFQALQKESLKILLNSAVNRPLLLTNYNFGDMGKVIQMPWKVTISNTGNRQLSIIDKRVSVGDTPDFRSYTGIDGGIFTLENQPVSFPIKLESGESQVYYLNVGALIPSKSYDIIHKINDGNPVSDRDAMIALGKAGIDMYGNPVEFKDNGESGVSIKFNSSGDSPTFWLSLFTGNSNRFNGVASKYNLLLENY